MIQDAKKNLTKKLAKVNMPSAFSGSGNNKKFIK